MAKGADPEGVNIGVLRARGRTGYASHPCLDRVSDRVMGMMYAPLGCLKPGFHILSVRPLARPCSRTQTTLLLPGGDTLPESAYPHLKTPKVQFFSSTCPLRTSDQSSSAFLSFALNPASRCNPYPQYTEDVHLWCTS